MMAEDPYTDLDVVVHLLSKEEIRQKKQKSQETKTKKDKPKKNEDNDAAYAARSNEGGKQQTM